MSDSVARYISRMIVTAGGGDGVRAGSAREVFRVFLRLGLTAFGGPAAHIAAMEDEIVRRRGWVTSREFMDLLSAANVIPGPNSTELAIHLGLRRAGWRGLVAAGVAFIGPSAVMVWVLAVLYSRYGQRPEVAVLLGGMQPVVLAVVVQAVWRLLRSVLATPVMIGVAMVSTVAVIAGVHEMVVLAGAAVAGVALALRGVGGGGGLPMLAMLGVPATLVAALPTVGTVFLSFLKIGSVLFGSGYVLLAFLRAEFVVRHGWLTEGQLLDAIAVGQVTPGPVFTSATFIGYLLAGHGGAVAATTGIFLPAFLFVLLSGAIVARVRRSPRASAALDAVNAASLALMVGVVYFMLGPVMASWTSSAIFLGAGALLLATRISAGWVLLAGALLGLWRAALL